MTRPLRRTHRIIWISLAFALPAILLLALAGREPALEPNPNLAMEQRR